MRISSKYRRKIVKTRDSSISISNAFIPSSIFNKKLSSFETITKYLRDSYGFKTKEIAEILNKSKQSTSRAYKISNQKYTDSIQVSNLHYLIPLNIFKTSPYSLLETLVVFLKHNHKLTFSEISTILMRDESTIWTSYHRAKSKEENEKKS